MRAAEMKPRSKGFVSQGLREVRFSDIRWTLDRLMVVLTGSTVIYRPVSWVRGGDGRSADDFRTRQDARR